MNVISALFASGCPTLSHVTWPISPHHDESLAGFTDRTCDHNGLWDPSVLIADAGLRLQRGFGHLARVTCELSAIATLLKVDPTWVENHRHRTTNEKRGGQGMLIDFHGATLRRAHLDYLLRRVVPTAIQEKAYHRDIWHVFTLPACATSGEFLVESCQQPGCGKDLEWSGHRRIGCCTNSDCEGTAASLTPTTVPNAHRSGLALAGALIHPSASVHSAITASLPEVLRSENRGDLFDLAWMLGCLNHSEGLKAVTSPASFSPMIRSEVLARGADRILTWPGCVSDALRESADGDCADTSVKLVVEILRAIVRKPKTFGRPAILLAEMLNGISTNSASTVVGHQLGLLSATKFAHAIGIDNSQMATLQRSTHVSRVLLSKGSRDIALFSPSDAEDVRHRIKSRLPAQAFASETGLGIDAVELLVNDGTLPLADDPVLHAIWPEAHLQPAAAAIMKDRITKKMRGGPAPVGSVKLSTALYGCPAGDKPWPAIIQSLITGRLILHRPNTKKLDIRSCLVSPEGLQTVHSLRLSRNCPKTRSEWLSEVDVRERLSTSSRNLRSLLAANELSTSGLFNGLTYQRSQIDAFTALNVSTLELRAKLGMGRADLSATLRGAKLLVDQHGFVPRIKAREKFGLHII